MFKTAAAIALSLVMLADGCQENPGQQPNPQHDARAPQERIITLEWSSNQPYTAKWQIDGGGGLYPKGEEGVASGKYKRELRVGKTPLIIMIITSGAKGSEGWARITDRREVGYASYTAISSPATAIATYEYKP